MQNLATKWTILSLVVALGLSACGAADMQGTVHEAVVRAPLVGADPLDERGSGQVLEVLPAGSYTYARIDGVDGWLVFTRFPATQGDTVHWRGFAERRPFRSRRLDRHFDRVVFASVDTEEEG